MTRLDAIDKDLQRESNLREKVEIMAVSELVMDSIDKTIVYLTQEKARLESEVNDHIDGHPHLKKDLELLNSIPGIGPKLSRMMLLVIRGREFTSASQLAAFLGLIPRLVESGRHKGRSMLSKTGSSQLRAKLYMAAIVASKHNPDIARQRHRLLSARKNKMQALGAAMRKLVHICFGVLKHQKEYTPQAC